MKHALNLSKPKFVFVSAAIAKKTVAVCRQLNFVKNVILIEGRKIDHFILSLGGLIKRQGVVDFDVEENVSREIDEHEQVAMIFCSSGTTGLPKGVEITQENLLSCLQTFRPNMSNIERLRNHSLAVLNIAPWFHVIGFVSMFMFACSVDNIFVFLPKFEEIVFYESIVKHKVNFLVVVPPIMVLLAKSSLVDKFDLSSIKGELKHFYLHRLVNFSSF